MTRPPDACGCAAQGCRRWTRRWGLKPEDTGWWLCCDHWGRLTKLEKRTYRRLQRTTEKVGTEWWRCLPLRRRYLRVWRALVRRSQQG